MKIANYFLSMVVALAITASANAGVQVWFQLEGSDNPGVMVDGPQGSGNTLNLVKPAGPGTTTLDIGVYVQATDTNVISGHSIRLLRDDASAAYASWDGSAGLDWTVQDNPFVINTGDILASNFGQAPFPLAGDSNVTPANGAVLSGILTLTITKTDDSTGTTSIFGAVGDNRFGSGGMVQFGPNSNALVNGTVTGAGTVDGLPTGTLPSITITNIPEPATLSLLGLGAIALIRRRR